MYMRDEMVPVSTQATIRYTKAPRAYPEYLSTFYMAPADEQLRIKIVEANERVKESKEKGEE